MYTVTIQIDVDDEVIDHDEFDMRFVLDQLTEDDVISIEHIRT